MSKKFTTSEVAALLDLPQRTVTHYLNTGVLKGVQHPITRSWVIPQEDLEAFLIERGLDPAMLTPPPKSAGRR